MSARFSSIRLLLAVLASGLGVSGCTAVGYMVGSELGDQKWGRPIPVERADVISRGMPVQVGLRDGGFVRGISLGPVALDSAGVPGRRPAIRLGVGNRMLLDRVFEKNLAIDAPTREQVPDTLVFALDSVQELRVPGSSGNASKEGAAVGLAVDLGVVMIWASGFVVLLWAAFFR